MEIRGCIGMEIRWCIWMEIRWCIGMAIRWCIGKEIRWFSVHSLGKLWLWTLCWLNCTNMYMCVAMEIIYHYSLYMICILYLKYPWHMCKYRWIQRIQIRNAIYTSQYNRLFHNTSAIDLRLLGCFIPVTMEMYSIITHLSSARFNVINLKTKRT